MLKAAFCFVKTVDVHSAFVCEGISADEWQGLVKADVGDFCRFSCYAEQIGNIVTNAIVI